MANCKSVADFLSGVAAKNVTTPLPDPDLGVLVQANLVRTFTQDEVEQAQQQLGELSATQDAVARDSAEQAREAAQLNADAKRTHSILFHIEGGAKRAAQSQQVQQDQAALAQVSADLQAQQRKFNDLMAYRAMLDGICPVGSKFVAMTAAGRVAQRDLGIRLYRVSDMDFSAYWTETQKVFGELNDWAGRSVQFEQGLTGALPGVDRSYLWAVSVGLGKSGGNADQRGNDFLSAFRALDGDTDNVENQLMASEVLSCSSRPFQERIDQVEGLQKEVHKTGVAKESALGVAAIVYMGRRADGTYALDSLSQYLQVTPSYESAAMMAILNRPAQETLGRFNQMRSTFLSWGFSPSEDVELASSYLAISDLPLETVAPKLAIISRGMSTYLQYPLVGAAVLAAIPTLEANETLNMLEHAYDILGSRTGPMSQTELICLAVRLLDGIQVASVDELDPTAAARAGGGAMTGGGYYYRPYYGPYFFFAPIIVTHGAYYSTFSGLGGAHPGHVHVGMGGGFGG
jgi:hypothetical protein